jgi:uncharacterized YccA/Bax inhibitor family protein
MFRSSNPTLKSDVFTRAHDRTATGAMTIEGTVNRAGILLIILFVTGAYTWNEVMTASRDFQQLPLFWIPVGFIGALVLALVTAFKPTSSPVTSPLYAALEGLALGAVSALMTIRYEGIVTQAVLGTLGVFAGMLFIYRSRIIRVTDRFRKGLMAAIFGIMFVYLASWILGFFGIQMPMVHSTGTLGLVFTLGVIVVASLSLLLDFDLIERGVQSQAPKYMEWYGAFALMVTLVWLYLEILRLLAILRGRD